MTLTYGFYDSLDGDRVYNAEQFSSIFDGIITDGIFQSFGNGFAVTDGSGMSVNVGTGRAWFDSTWTYNSASYPLTLDAADPTLPRIDTVVLEVNKGTSIRANSLKIVKGTPASTPSQPTLTNNETVTQYPLANIAVAAGLSEILTSHITNRIGTDTPFITGILTTIDMTWLFAQWDANFNDWFTDLQNELDSNQAANLQSQINDIEAILALGTIPYRNLLINGSMMVSQRGAGETGITNSGYKKAPDRWLNTWSGTVTAVASVYQGSDVPTGQGFPRCYKIVFTTPMASLNATTQIALEQRIQGRLCQQIKKGTVNAEQLALSFWVKSAKTGTHIIELLDSDNSRGISKAYTINVANTWEFKTVIIDADTTGTLDFDNNMSLRLMFWIAAGTDYTSGTLRSTWGAHLPNLNRAVGQVNVADAASNEFVLTGVQLEIGDTVTAFEHLPYDVVLERCLPYYQLIGSGSNSILGTGYYSATNTIIVTIPLTSPMRDIPSLDMVTGTNYYATQLADTFNSLTLNTPTTNRLVSLYNSTEVSGTVGSAFMVKTNNASAYLGLSAEL